MRIGINEDDRGKSILSIFFRARAPPPIKARPRSFVVTKVNDN